MRFGGPVFGWTTPGEWITRLAQAGYRTAYCPVGEDATTAEIERYRRAAELADITIAEVGIWRNVLDPDPEKRRAAIDFAKARLLLAERIGARCAVNLSGGHGHEWDGHSADNYTAETLEQIVVTVREILDDVQPRYAKYAVETMPWMVPDSAESALELVAAVNRAGFAIHYDPVNLVNSPRHYYATGVMAEHFLNKVGAHVVAVHLKDLVLTSKLTVHLDEVRPGLGGYDIGALLRAVQHHLSADTPILLEHLPTEEEYIAARNHVREVALASDIDL